jgi:hypothetical protein
MIYAYARDARGVSIRSFEGRTDLILRTSKIRSGRTVRCYVLETFVFLGHVNDRSVPERLQYVWPSRVTTTITVRGAHRGTHAL